MNKLLALTTINAIDPLPALGRKVQIQTAAATPKDKPVPGKEHLFVDPMGMMAYRPPTPPAKPAAAVRHLVIERVAGLNDDIKATQVPWCPARRIPFEEMIAMQQQAFSARAAEIENQRQLAVEAMRAMVVYPTIQPNRKPVTYADIVREDQRINDLARMTGVSPLAGGKTWATLKPSGLRSSSTEEYARQAKVQGTLNQAAAWPAETRQNQGLNWPWDR